MGASYPIIRRGVRCRCPDLDAHQMPPCWFAQTLKNVFIAPGPSPRVLVAHDATHYITGTHNQRLPTRRRRVMALAINDTAPDFEAETTEGKIRFHDWIGDKWT